MMYSYEFSSYSDKEYDLIRSMLTDEGVHDDVDSANSNDAGYQTDKKEFQNNYEIDHDHFSVNFVDTDFGRSANEIVEFLPVDGGQSGPQDEIGGIASLTERTDRTSITQEIDSPRAGVVSESNESINLNPASQLAQPSTSPAAARAKRTRAATPPTTHVARAPKRGRGNRGAHVRDRPDMHQAARDGAAHWHQQLRRVRDTWAAAALASPAFGAAHRPAADAATARVKAKLECLLRTLQLAAHAGLIAPQPAPPPPAGGGGPGPAGDFFGWAGFLVRPGRAAEFRAAVTGLFPAGFREESVRQTFRRAGLVPAGWRWEDGWDGAAPFGPVHRAGPAAPH
jgi:hypothetical protein